LRWSGGAETPEDQKPGFSVAKTPCDVPGVPKGDSLLAYIAKNLVSQYLQVFAKQKVLADGLPEPSVLSASEYSTFVLPSQV
jgi:hypothetical protein